MLVTYWQCPGCCFALVGSSKSLTKRRGGVLDTRRNDSVYLYWTWNQREATTGNGAHQPLSLLDELVEATGCSFPLHVPTFSCALTSLRTGCSKAGFIVFQESTNCKIRAELDSLIGSNGHPQTATCRDVVEFIRSCSKLEGKN